MPRPVLFIQGAGKGAWDEDRLMAASLQAALGGGYEVVCPQMPDEENVPFAAWKSQIESRIRARRNEVILVGHSIGGSVLLKCLCEPRFARNIAGLFILAAPYWGEEPGWEWDEVVLPPDLAAKLNGRWPIVFFHSRDDEVVPFKHLSMYAARVPRATIREVDGRGHQFNNGLADVAGEIVQLSKNSASTQ
jgi:uncharacterized protein